MIELSNLEDTLLTLPAEAHKELLHFIEHLQHKYQTSQPGNVVKLGGLWADINLDVSDEDIRALRHHVTRHAMSKV